MNIKDTAEKLAKAGITNAMYEARLLVNQFLSIPMSTIITMNDTKLDCFAGFDEFSRAVTMRARRYPLQYILGEWEFYGLPFYVNESCLIPRIDTEVIVEAAIAELSRKPPKKEEPQGGKKTPREDRIKRYLDLCTGSGCIAAAVLKNVPNSFGFCVDIDPNAAKVAERNLIRNGLTGRYRVIVGDARESRFDSSTKFDLITANPPYVTAAEMNELEPELKYEPSMALTDHGDGLSFYGKIIEAYKSHLKPEGKIIFEHGAAQADAVIEIARKHGMSAQTIYDYGDKKRGEILSIG